MDEPHAARLDAGAGAAAGLLSRAAPGRWVAEPALAEPEHRRSALALERRPAAAGAEAERRRLPIRSPQASG